MLWMLVMKWYNIKKRISPHTNYTDRIISKCNPDFILPISTPTLDVGAATPRRLVSTVGCIQSKKMFRRPPDRKRKKYAHVNYENAPTCTNHFFFSLFFFAPLASYITSTVWIYTESQLSEYIHLFIKLPQQHRQISTKIQPRYPQISPVLRRKEYVCMEWWRPQSVILSVIILIIKAYHQVKKKKKK